MGETKHKYLIRLEAENGKVVSAELQKVGADGKASFQKLEEGAVKADHRMGLMARTIVTRLLPALSAGAFGNAVRGAIRDLGDLTDAAERVGVSAEKLQVFRLLGDDVGIGAAAADSALEDFVKRVGQAQAGTGKLLEILEDYNIALVDGSGKARAWGDILNDIAEIIQNTGDAQERLRVASAAGLSDFTAALQKGQEGLSAHEKKVREAGLVIEESLVKKADEFDKAWSRAFLRFSIGFKNGVIKVLSEAKPLFDRIIEYQVRLTGYSPGGGMSKFPPFLGQQGIDGEGDTPADRLESYYNKLASDGLAPREILKRTSKTDRKGDEDGARKIRDVTDALKFRNEQLTRSAELQDLNNQLRAAGIDLNSKDGQAIRELVGEYHDFTRVQEAQERTARDVKRQWDEQRKSAESMGAAINDLVMNFDDLGSVARRLLADLAQSAIQMGSGGSASSGLGGMIAEALFGGQALYSMSAGGVPIPGHKPTPPRASGGPANAGGSYLVGEQGPEILRMGNKGGAVVPNHAAGGGGMVVNIDAKGADEGGLARVENAIRTLGGQVNRIDQTFEARAAGAASDQRKRTLNYLR